MANHHFLLTCDGGRNPYTSRMYIVIKTVRKNGREYQYRYEQTSYRVGKRVRTKSRYLGPIGKALSAIGGFIEANRARGPIIDEDALLRSVQAAEAKHAAMIEKFHEVTGLRVGPDDPTLGASQPAADVSNSADRSSENSPNAKS